MNIIKFKSKNRSVITILSAATMAFTSQSNAAVTVTFEQVGSDVVATWNGSFNPGNFAEDQITVGAYYIGSDSELLAVSNANTDYDIWTGGTFSITTLSASPTSMTPIANTLFGFEFGDFLFNGINNDTADSAIVDFGDGSTYTMTWVGQTLSAIGAENFNNTLAWTSSAGGTNTISYNTIPEPSVLFLGVLGCFGFLVRRHRAS
jgi:hypothetical protein